MESILKFIDEIKEDQLKPKEKQQDRPDWDLFFIHSAYNTSTRSPCSRLHVGCVLVEDNHIIAQGYNGFPSGAPHVSVVRDGHEQMTVHSEQNAVSDCAKRGVSTKGTTAYVTHFPCINCAKILVSAGIKIVKYHEDYKNDPLAKKIFDLAEVEIIKLDLKKYRKKIETKKEKDDKKP